MRAGCVDLDAIGGAVRDSRPERVLVETHRAVEVTDFESEMSQAERADNRRPPI
jgi:hypothetical protein